MHHSNKIDIIMSLPVHYYIPHTLFLSRKWITVVANLMVT